MMLKDQARVGIIGTGWWSTTAHIPSLKDNPDAQLVAMADARPEALERACSVYGRCNTYTDYRDMLAKEQLDGVIVAVNHSAHYEVTKGALEAGVHVLLEKPMVLKAAHAHDLMNLAQQRGVELMIGYPWLLKETARWGKEIMQSGELGAIQYVSCLFSSMVIEFLRGNDESYRKIFGYPVTGPGQAYSDPALSGGGQGHLQITHSAASMFYLSDLQADKVTCFMENFGLAVDVADAIALRFKPVERYAAVGVVGSTGNLGPGDGGHLEIQIYCENGRLTVDHSQGAGYMRTMDGVEKRFGPLPPERRYPQNDTSKHLTDVILGKATNQLPAIYGVRTVEMLDAAYTSNARGGAPVSVDDLIRQPVESGE